MPRRAGKTPTEVRENMRRKEQGLPSIAASKPRQNPRTILPETKKARTQAILAEMLSKKSRAIVQKVINKALDDKDKDQMECLKIVMDRIVPKDYMAKAANKSGNINIQIISSDGNVSVNEEEVVDVEFEEVEGENE
jgi:hypothetical protein